MELPHYPKEPGFPGSFTDVIVRDRPYIEREARRIQFISCYQCETDYHRLHGREGRFTFRFGKLPWRWSWLKEGEVYWNFKTEADFQRELNGAWGILHSGTEAVDAETLAVFREECYSLAVTGWFNHGTKAWEICEPTTERQSHRSWVAQTAPPAGLATLGSGFNMVRAAEI